MTEPQNNEDHIKKDVTNNEPENQAQENKKEEEDPKEKSWRAVREKLKEDERLKKEQDEKIIAQQHMIQMLEKALQNGSVANTQAAQNQTGLADIHDQEWVTGEQLKKYLDKDRKEREEERMRLEAEVRQRETISQLSAKYPDYKQVLTKENIAYLEYHEPELASAINQIQDPYLQIATAYKHVKNFVPQISDEDKKKMERTQNMPRSPATPGINVGTGSDPYMSRKPSEERKRDLYEESIRYAR